MLLMLALLSHFIGQSAGQCPPACTCLQGNTRIVCTGAQYTEFPDFPTSIKESAQVVYVYQHTASLAISFISHTELWGIESQQLCQTIWKDLFTFGNCEFMNRLQGEQSISVICSYSMGWLIKQSTVPLFVISAEILMEIVLVILNLVVFLLALWLICKLSCWFNCLLLCTIEIYQTICWQKLRIIYS